MGAGPSSIRAPDSSTRPGRGRRAWLIVPLAAALLGGVAWAGLWSPWVRVGSVEVVGVQRVDELMVRQAAFGQWHRPLVTVDRAAIARQVRALPLVRSVSVTRRWPDTVRITVVERVAVAVIPDGERGLVLVDGTGVTLGAVPVAPAGLPVVEVPVERAGAGALRACLRVLADLPPPLTGQVRRIGAEGGDGVWLELSGDRRVVWGSAERNGEKAQVLTALLKQPAAVYDVSAPGAPALVPRE